MATTVVVRGSSEEHVRAAGAYKDSYSRRVSIHLVRRTR